MKLDKLPEYQESITSKLCRTIYEVRRCDYCYLVKTCCPTHYIEISELVLKDQQEKF